MRGFAGADLSEAWFGFSGMGWESWDGCWWRGVRIEVIGLLVGDGEVQLIVERGGI